MTSSPLGFGVQTFSAYGISGEFEIGSGLNRTCARYLLTKIKPGSTGSWESILASRMQPWREVFNVEELTFDELLQRDLDDSRVAMDLIPYLLGHGSNYARFFPPILAILAPLRGDKKGIERFYPDRAAVEAGRDIFGDLFSISPVLIDQNRSPLSQLEFNAARAGFVIVDGQHRAMAVLAIHRQITQSWERNPFAAYYNHLNITADQASTIELPVCIVYFPELTEKNEPLRERGIDLITVSRDIFLTVNKNAKEVSESRELLLDDDDFAARLMRNTLSKLKGRPIAESGLSRIFCFAFGDADDENIQMTGRPEYSSSKAMHRIHCAACFGLQDGFKLDARNDLTDGRAIRSTDRPVALLRGTQLEAIDRISRTSARLHPDRETKEIVKLLGDFSDIPIIAMFDGLLPFRCHNAAMTAVKTTLQRPEIRSNPDQARVYSLLFEGAGTRGVFFEHLKRIQEIDEQGANNQGPMGNYIRNQDQEAKTVYKALESREVEIKNIRALKFFSIDEMTNGGEETIHEAVRIATPIINAFWTQAFQLGFCLTVHGLVKELTQATDVKYEQRLHDTETISKLLVDCLNVYFSPGDPTVMHRTVTNEIRNSKRLQVFSPSSNGLRGNHAMSVKELNQSEYRFFRYAILEIVHSDYALPTLKVGLSHTATEFKERYLKYVLPELTNAIFSQRDAYLKAGVDATQRSNDFKNKVTLARALAEAAGEDPDEKEEEFNRKNAEEIRVVFTENLKASLGTCSPNREQFQENIRKKLG